MSISNPVVDLLFVFGSVYKRSCLTELFPPSPLPLLLPLDPEMILDHFAPSR